jgi:hypothetical protein
MSKFDKTLVMMIGAFALGHAVVFNVNTAIVFAVLAFSLVLVLGDKV